MKIKLLFAYVFEFLRDGFYLGIFLLLPFIAKDIHLTLFQAGFLQTIVNLLIMLLAIPTVGLLVKFGEIRMLLFSLILYAIGFVSLTFAHSYIALLSIYALMGIAFGLYATISSHIVTTWFVQSSRGKELGKLMAVGDIAKVLFSVGIGLGAGFIGWKEISLVMGLTTGLLFVLFSLLILRESSFKEQPVVPNRTTGHVSYAFFFKHKQFVLSLITSSLDQGVNAPFYSFLPFLLLHKGVSIAFIGEFTGIYFAGNVISRLFFGRLVDTIGSAKILIFLEIIMAIITFLLAISPWIFLVGTLALLLGFVTEGTDPATASMGAEALEHIPHAEKAAGIRALSIGVAKSLFPLLLGLLASNMGIIWGFYALAAACLLPIIPAALFLQQQKNQT